MIYLDSSALLKIWVYESQSEDVRRAFENADQAATSAIAQVECRAALARLHRTGLLSDQHIALALEQQDTDLQSLIQHHVTSSVLDDAGQLALRHQLKSLDAIHLASALMLRLLPATNPLVFMTFDLKLSRAAAAEGLKVWPDVGQP